MSVHVGYGQYTYAAGADLTGKKFYAAMLSTTVAKTVLVCTDPRKFIGIIESAGTTEHNGVATVEVRTTPENCTIQTGGRMKGVAQAAVTIGAPVTVHSDGRFRVAVTGETIVGYAEEAAAQANDYFSFLAVSPGLVA